MGVGWLCKTVLAVLAPIDTARKQGIKMEGNTFQSFAILDGQNRVIARDLSDRGRAEAVMSAATARGHSGLHLVIVEGEPKKLSADELEALQAAGRNEGQNTGSSGGGGGGGSSSRGR